MFKKKMTLTPEEAEAYLQQEMFDKKIFTSFTIQVVCNYHEVPY